MSSWHYQPASRPKFGLFSYQTRFLLCKLMNLFKGFIGTPDLAISKGFPPQSLRVTREIREISRFSEEQRGKIERVKFFICFVLLSKNILIKLLKISSDFPSSFSNSQKPCIVPASWWEKFLVMFINFVLFCHRGLMLFGGLFLREILWIFIRALTPNESLDSFTRLFFTISILLAFSPFSLSNWHMLKKSTFLLSIFVFSSTFSLPSFGAGNPEFELGKFCNKWSMPFSLALSPKKMEKTEISLSPHLLLEWGSCEALCSRRWVSWTSKKHLWSLWVFEVRKIFSSL